MAMGHKAAAWMAGGFLLAIGSSAAGGAAGQARGPAPLPPEIPWNGASRTLVVPATDPWVTPAERSGLRRTPSYDETVAWLQKLAAAAPQLQLVSLGRAPRGATSGW